MRKGLLYTSGLVLCLMSGEVLASDDLAGNRAPRTLVAPLSAEKVAAAKQVYIETMDAYHQAGYILAEAEAKMRDTGVGQGRIDELMQDPSAQLDAFRVRLEKARADLRAMGVEPEDKEPVRSKI
jgi:hypothetical protein